MLRSMLQTPSPPHADSHTDNSSVDVYSFAITLLEVACVSLGESARFVRSQFSLSGGEREYAAPAPTLELTLTRFLPSSLLTFVIYEQARRLLVGNYMD